MVLGGHSASGVSLSVIGQGTSCFARFACYAGSSIRRAALGLRSLGEADSPRWVRMGRCLSAEPLDVESANIVGCRFFSERSASSRSVSPGERPFALIGPDHATLSHQKPAGET